jgi:hypothetical protein
MSQGEDKKEGVWGKLISELVAFVPKDLQEMVGLQVGIWLFVPPMILLGGAMALLKAFKEPPKQEVPCWQIQTVEGRAFKINRCTGETEELPAAPKASAEKP